MKSNYWFKGAIFSTFFVCCIIIILLCASLSTDFWISSTAKRNITQKSSGTINFGLFNGKKVLNSGLGDRPTVIKGKSHVEIQIKLFIHVVQCIVIQGLQQSHTCLLTVVSDLAKELELPCNTQHT